MVQKRARGDVTLVVGFVDYLLGERGLAEITAESYRNRLQAIEDYVRKPAEDIDSNDMRRFLRSAPYKPATKHGQLVALRQFHQWGALEGHWPLNGIMSLRGPKVPDDPLPPLTREDAWDVLSSCSSPTSYRAVYLGLYAGMRVFESASITEREWKDDRFDFIGKGRKRRQVPIHPVLHEVKDMILSSQASVESLKAAVRSLSWSLQTPMSTHTLRRTFGDTLYNDFEVPWEVVQSLLGHTLGVTGKYAQPRFERKVEAVQKLVYGPPLTPAA